MYKRQILNAVNGGLSAENGIWCPKCGDALDIDIVNGVLAIGCFGCGEYTPISELMKLHLNDAVPVVRCKDCVYKARDVYKRQSLRISPLHREFRLPLPYSSQPVSSATPMLSTGLSHLT